MGVLTKIEEQKRLYLDLKKTIDAELRQLRSDRLRNAKLEYAKSVLEAWNAGAQNVSALARAMGTSDRKSVYDLLELARGEEVKNLQIGDRVCQVHDGLTRAGTIVAQDFKGWDVGVLWDNSSLALGYKADELGFACHCGRPATYGYDDDPTHTRGMCRPCDAARCDVDLSACNASVTL